MVILFFSGCLNTGQCYMISVTLGKLEASDSWSLESALLTSGGNIYSLNTVKL